MRMEKKGMSDEKAKQIENERMSDFILNTDDSWNEFDYPSEVSDVNSSFDDSNSPHVADKPNSVPHSPHTPSGRSSGTSTFYSQTWPGEATSRLGSTQLPAATSTPHFSVYGNSPLSHHSSPSPLSPYSSAVGTPPAFPGARPYDFYQSPFSHPPMVIRSIYNL